MRTLLTIVRYAPSGEPIVHTRPLCKGQQRVTLDDVEAMIGDLQMAAIDLRAWQAMSPARERVS